ncbi:phagocyte signaling-impaired protein [Anopheles ziemanni]|uniref:phagocyte signaling-impaired protein n=1 Tax=Anopheles coustani TaxID=139045 RepID=UPI002657D2A0|nr:phagocyte signaling-impaired protein [Anopheles coustani]XP_058173245.1 phagocyte signaling-impaired protein [Anopheles ziemanni]
MQNDDFVYERKLRPIWESIEIGNYKKALQDAEKMLKKKPTMQCARALKAWAFLRLGREEESNAIIATLEKEEPVEAPTLHALTLCYKETHRLDKICTLFSNAVRQVPGSEELLSQLFIAYMRVDDFKAQQSVALQLYKLRPRNSYYFWAVMSIVLQALRGPDADNAQKVQLLLALSQRMVDKFIAENKLEGAQEAQLYLQILQEQHKYGEAYDFLHGALCQKLYPGAPVYGKIDLLKKLNKWGELNRLLKELLLQDQDRWDYYQDYINSTFELIKVGETPDGTDHTVEMCHEFLCDIIEAQAKKCRGPYLARLELNRRMLEQRYDEEQLFGKMSDMLAEYFELFGDKPCCALDMKLFLEYVRPASERRVLAAKLLNGLGLSSATLPASKAQMQRHICTLQLARYSGAHAVVSEELLHAIYTSLSLHYEHGFNAHGQGLLVTDMGPSDPYAILAAQIMYERAWRIQRSEPAIEALCLLAHLLSNSVNNFHAKLLVLQLYHRLGLTLAAQEAYEALDIKHIQLDSLGYLHCAHLANGGFPAFAKTIYERTLNFFENDNEAAAEFPKASYNFGTYSKLVEIIDFRNRLTNSFHFTLVSVEAQLLMVVGFVGTLPQLLSLYRQTRPKPGDDRIRWNKLADNRDLTIFVCWDPTSNDEEGDATKTSHPMANGNEREQPFAPANSKPVGALLEERREALQKVSYEQDYDLLRLRSGLQRIVFSLVELSLVRPSGQEETSGATSEYAVSLKLRDHWVTLMEEIRRKQHVPISGRYLVNLLPSRLHLYLRLPYEAVFTHLADFVLSLWRGYSSEHKQNPNTTSLEALSQQAERCANDVTNLSETLKRAIDTYHESVDLLWHWKATHELVNGCIEMISLMVFVLAVCYDKYVHASATPTVTPASGKRSKKQTTNDAAANSDTATNGASGPTPACVPEKDRLALVTKVLRELKQRINEVDLALASWKAPVVEDTLSAAVERMSLNPKCATNVEAAIVVNTQSEVKELRKLVKDKLKLMSKAI